MEDNKSTNVKKTVKSGITFGSALAMVISYTAWKSVGWAIFMDYLVGCMSYTSFCVTKFTYVKVMPSDPKTIPFYERYGFQQYDNYSAMVRKHFL